MNCGTISEALGTGSDQQETAETIYGVVPAIVSNLQDPEKLGRIKVTFPWLAAESETDWVRVLSPYASSGMGIFFSPEVGDEVLVVFQKGNVNAPYIIGSVWSSKAKPPEENADGKNNVKLIKTRAGHTITLDDNTESQAAKIEIKSSSGHTVTLDDVAGGEKIEVKDKGGQNSITMDAVGNTIAIEGGMKIDIKATAINIEASGALTLKGATVTAQATGIAEIKGSMVKIN